MEQTFTLQSVQKVIGLEETASTQQVAQALAATEPDGTLVLACRQTGASDRTGKPFWAGEGGVYFTLIVAPQHTPDATRLALAMAHAIADTVSQVLGLRTKWTPQGDVCVYHKQAHQWKKCAGVWVQPACAGRWLIGTGVYLNNRLPVSCQKTAVSLKTLLGSATSKELFLDCVLDNFWKEYLFV